MYQLKIKRTCVLLLLGTVLGCTNSDSSGQDERVLLHEDSVPLSPAKSEVKQEIPASVEEIQKAYKIIFEAYQKGQLDSTTFKYNCDGEKSGTVSYFSANGKLKMIKHSYAEYDHHEMLDQYYVVDDMPFFAHLKSLSWSFDSGPEGATKDVITEKRIYLTDWKAIKCLEKKYEIRLHAGLNPKPENIPNKEVACESTNLSIEKPFKLLAKYWKTSPPNCLKE